MSGSSAVERKQRFTVCGVAGHNRGDDAIALAMARGILDRRPQAVVSIAMLQLGAIASAPGIAPFLCLRRSPTGLAQLAFNIARSDLVILGGGSLIQDKFGGDRIRGVLGYAWLVSLLAVLFRKPLVTAPLGVDTLHHDRSRTAAAEVLARCRALFLRDARSFENALELKNGRAPSVQRVCDPAFSLPGTLPEVLPEEAPVVLAPAFEGEFDELVADIFAGIADRLAAQTNRKIVVVAMDDRAEEDAGKLGMIVERLGPAARERVSTAAPSDLGSAIELLRGSAGVIAMRLHAMILSYGFVPVVCLSRTTKTEAFMEDYLVPGQALDAQSDPAETANLLVGAVGAWPDKVRQRDIRAMRLGELAGYFDRIVEMAKPGR